MYRESIYFWENDPEVSLEVYIPSEGENLPAVVILPGGAYFALSDKEGGEVAEFFAGKGFASFVLRYSTMHPSFDMPYTDKNPHTVFPEPLYVVAAAIRLVRSRAQDFRIDPNALSLMGFSAGGHLAANYCNEWSSPAVRDAVGATEDEIRPNVCVLCYAATKLRPGKATMNLAVFGERDNYSAELVKRWCAAENVNSANPPTFLWHCATDSMVPASHSIEMACALSDEGIPYEIHIFSEGDHASGVSAGMACESWTELAANFIKRYI